MNAQSFYEAEASCNLLFQLTPLFTQPGWYVRLCNSNKVIGPFRYKDEAEIAAKRLKLIQTPSPELVIH